MAALQIIVTLVCSSEEVSSGSFYSDILATLQVQMRHKKKLHRLWGQTA